MPRYTTTTSSNKYSKTPKIQQHYQEKLTNTAHKSHNNPPSQPYNLTTVLRQSKGSTLANSGTRYDPPKVECLLLIRPTTTTGASSPTSTSITQHTSEHTGNTRVVHRHNLTHKATVEYTLPHCRQIILQQPTPHHTGTAAVPKDRPKVTTESLANPDVSLSTAKVPVSLPLDTTHGHNDTSSYREPTKVALTHLCGSGSNDTAQHSDLGPKAFQTLLPTLIDSSSTTTQD